MFRSLEVRWFYGGAVPGPVREWFRSGDRAPESEPARVDHYLCLVDDESLGVKLREGRVEIKQRFGEDGIRQFGGQARGRVEHWRKWSFPIDNSGGRLGGMLVPRSAWIAVEKARELRRYSLALGNQLEAARAGQFPARGCNAELSTLSVAGQAWWSICLEAYGGESLLQEALMLTAAHVFGRPLATFALTENESFGYPRWLASLAPGRDARQA